MYKIKIEDIIGFVFTDVDISTGVNEVEFYIGDKTAVYMGAMDTGYNYPIELIDVIGDINDLVNSPILIAYESTNKGMPDENGDNNEYIWTFYHIGTLKGFVTFRWHSIHSVDYCEEVSILLDRDVLNIMEN